MGTGALGKSGTRTLAVDPSCPVGYKWSLGGLIFYQHIPRILDWNGKLAMRWWECFYCGSPQQQPFGGWSETEMPQASVSQHNIVLQPDDQYYSMSWPIYYFTMACYFLALQTCLISQPNYLLSVTFLCIFSMNLISIFLINQICLFPKCKSISLI